MITTDDPRYASIHRMVRRIRGPAREQQCVRCPKQAEVWAQVHTEEGTDPWADYVPLCRSCHCIYDRVNVGTVRSAETRAKISVARTGTTRVVSAATRERIRQGALRRWERERSR